MGVQRRAVDAQLAQDVAQQAAALAGGAEQHCGADFQALQLLQQVYQVHFLDLGWQQQVLLLQWVRRTQSLVFLDTHAFGI